MTTLIWHRPTDPVKKREAYRMVVDADDEALSRLLSNVNIEKRLFQYRPMKKPVRMTLDGYEYKLWFFKKGAPNSFEIEAKAAEHAT